MTTQIHSSLKVVLATVAGTAILSGCAGTPAGDIATQILSPTAATTDPYMGSVWIGGTEYDMHRSETSGNWYIRDQRRRTHACSGNSKAGCALTAAGLPRPHEGDGGGGHSH